MRVVCLAIVLARCAIVTAVSAQVLTQHYNLNIPRQPLDTALKDFAQQTGLQIARLSDVVQGDAMIGPIIGEYSVEQALHSLLGPPGLTYKIVNERTIAVVNPGALPLCSAGPMVRGDFSLHDGVGPGPPNGLIPARNLRRKMMDMTHTHLFAVLAGTILSGACAVAAAQGEPQPWQNNLKPPPELKALSRIVANGTFTGHIVAGQLGSGARVKDAPGMSTRGTHVCKWILGGMWAECQDTDTMGTGKDAVTWHALLLYGWDREDKVYRMVSVDNMGYSISTPGRLDGPSKIVFESPTDQIVMGQPTRFRFTCDFSDPKVLKFRDERSIRGGPWTVHEEVDELDDPVSPP